MDAVTFFEYYDNLPTKFDQKQLRYSIITNCKISKHTFYSWLDRQNIPDEKSRLIISELLDRPLNQLFPQN
jgi:hypothetical protein